MSVHLSAPAADSAPKLIRLPANLLPTVREYAAAMTARKAAEKEARNADNVAKGLKATLLAAMKGSPSAVCGEAVLTVKTSADAPATLTKRDGSTVAWELVTAVLMGNAQLPVSEVAGIYGGRSGSTSLDVMGA